MDIYFYRKVLGEDYGWKERKRIEFWRVSW